MIASTSSAQVNETLSQTPICQSFCEHCVVVLHIKLDVAVSFTHGTFTFKGVPEPGDVVHRNCYERHKQHLD